MVVNDVINITQFKLNCTISVLQEYRLKIVGPCRYTIRRQDYILKFSLAIKECFSMGPKTHIYKGWNFNGGNYLFTTDTK